MTHDKPSEDRQTAACKALERAQAADPRRSPFGLYASDDWAGGAGLFHWYPTADALLAAIREDLVHAFFDADDNEAETVARDAAAVLEGVRDLRELDEALRKRLNELFDGVQELVWVGTFTQLCESDDEWASELRCSFHECTDEDEDEVDGEKGGGGDGEGDGERCADLERPIAPSAIVDFIEFLREYGC